MSNRFSHAARWVLRCGLGGVLVYAGIAKMQAPLSFADNITSYDILPTAAIAPLALALPPFEILIGILLVAGWLRRPALLAASSLFTIFLLALIQAWLRNLPIDCGCFGPSGKHPLWLSVLRDLILLTASACLYFREVATSFHASASASPASSR